MTNTIRVFTELLNVLSRPPGWFVPAKMCSKASDRPDGADAPARNDRRDDMDSTRRQLKASELQANGDNPNAVLPYYSSCPFKYFSQTHVNSLSKQVSINLQIHFNLSCLLVCLRRLPLAFLFNAFSVRFPVSVLFCLPPVLIGCSALDECLFWCPSELHECGSLSCGRAFAPAFRV